MAVTQGVAGSTGGGGGAVTLAAGSVQSGAYLAGSLADGAIVTLGNVNDPAVGDANGSLNAHARQIAKVLTAGITVTANAGTGTQAVSAVSLPLPSGASTEATLALIKAKTDNIDVALSTRTKPADSQTVTATALPLPTGASTEATLALIKAKTDNLDVLLSTRTKPADSQTVTGAVTANAGTGTFPMQATAASPGAVRLSDGAAFYDAAKTGQLPAALVGNRLDVNVGKVPGTVSTVNSSTANLANGAVFTGTSEDVSGYSSVAVNVFADQSSAANGLSLQWSSNGTNWDIVNTYTVTLNVGQTVLLPPRAQFFRVVYTNGGVTQTNFRLQTVYHQTQLSQDVGTAAQQVQGTAATGAAVVGNPVLIGGSDGTNAQPLKVDTTGRPTINGQMAAGGAASGGNPMMIGVSDGSNNNQPARGTVAADALTNALLSVAVTPYTELFNGVSWDRQRNNVDVTLLASAARTTAQNSANITTYNCKGIIVTVDLTASGGAISLTPSINYIDPASGKAIPLLTGATIAATGTFTYWVNENALASVAAPFTKTAQADLGRVITVNIAVGNANSQTYSVGYTLIP